MSRFEGFEGIVPSSQGRVYEPGIKTLEQELAEMIVDFHIRIPPDGEDYGTLIWVTGVRRREAQLQSVLEPEIAGSFDSNSAYIIYSG